MTFCTLPSPRDMTREYQAYRAQPHEKQKLRASALQVIRTFRKQAQTRDNTVWARFSAYVHPVTSEVSGVKIKRALRLFLTRRQEHRCCYCRRWLMNNAYASPIEHILPKSTYPQFALQFWNLALSCYHCNELKKKDDWGRFAAHHPHYPQPAAAAHFFHPRYHDYNEHVRFFRIESNHGYLSAFNGITDQGRHLCTHLLCKIAGKESLCQSTPAVAEFLAVMEAFQGSPEEPPRTALEAFRAELDNAIMARLDDAGATAA
ncbi:HNH endonuclease [Pseudomonas sp. SDO524_S393]